MTDSVQTAMPKVRSANSGDLASITQLLTASDLPTVGVGDARCHFVVAEADGDLVGVVGVQTCGDRFALLRSTAVAEAWRGRRVGQMLVERAIDEAKARGIEALYLLTTTAEHYFPNFGFSKVERSALPDEIKATEEFQSACPASATVMTLSLG